VAEHLGNTPAVCRKCYIHPIVLSAFQDQAVFDLWAAERKSSAGPDGLQPSEAALLRFLAKAIAA
jgi:DNA topoisomerase I